MDAYLIDWVNLLLRWAHVITAIAWIGSSFYFVFLDNSLTPPSSDDLKAKGVDGELWAVHGGGFYHPQKYLVAPKRLPEHLHWFYWESYWTWITGFALFTVLYLFNASTFLVDKSVYDWSPGAAIGVSLSFLVVFWVIYDAICRAFGQRSSGDLIVGVLVFVFIVAASWIACQLFAGRAAFLLVGAMIATAMSANVFFWIIPGQRKVIAQMKAGQPVDPIHGQRAKQRSVHNTYFTLPVLVAMLSNHYGWLYQGRAQLDRAGAADARRRVDPPLLRRTPQGQGERRDAAVGLRGIRVRGARGDGVLACAAAAPGRCDRESAGAGDDGAGQGSDRPALRAVPQRATAAEERRAAHARADQAACADRVPAVVGAEADAAEQRDADDRRRTCAAQALVRVGRAGELMLDAGLHSVGRRDMMKRLLPCVLAAGLALTALHAGAQVAPSRAEAAAYTGLHAAAQRGDVATIERLASASRATLESRDGHGRTPLHVATFARQRSAIAALLRAGADPGALENDRYDAVTIAAVADDEATLDVLLSMGASAKLVTSRYDGTALIAAAHLGHDGVVRRLIAAGAPLDHVNNLHWTALIEAVVLGDGGPRHQGTVRALIDAGADPRLADREGRTPLQLARARGHAAIAQMLERATTR